MDDVAQQPSGFVPDSEFASDQQQASVQSPQEAPSPSSFIPDSEFKADAQPSGFIPDEQFQSDHDKYGTLEQQVKSGLEGFAQGVAGPLAPLIEKGLGVDEEDIKGRAEENPWTHGLSEAAGFGSSLLTGVGEGALLSKAGEAVAGATGGSKIAQGAIKLATEMGLLSTGDEATKYILDAPTSAGSAAVNIGLSALLGGVTGGVFSGLGSLAKKGLESVPEGLSEFTDRMKYRMTGAEPAEALHNEIDSALTKFHGINDETWGATGIKAQALAKVMPEMSDKILEQGNNIVQKAQTMLEDQMTEGAAPHHLKEFERDLTNLKSIIEAPNSTSGEVFDAINNFKQEVQAYSKGKYGPFALTKADAGYNFINATKALGHDVKGALEDSKVWGKAANVQKSLNKAFSDVLPAVKDMESKFASKVGGEAFTDPAKVQSYLNSNGKTTSQSIRQKMLGNFVDQFDKYQNSLNKIYDAAGIDNPHPEVGLSAMRESLEKQSPWAKAADQWYEKGLTDAGAKALGGAAGAYAGDKSGIPGGGYVGLMLGGAAGGSMLHAILPKMMEKAVNAKAFNNALKFSQAALKGQASIQKAAEGVFKSGVMPNLHYAMPTSEKLDKLDKQLDAVNAQPDKLLSNVKALDHYMPGQADEIAGATGRAAQYMQQLKPKSVQVSPMDTKQEPTSAQTTAYRRQLSIAEQPLQIMQHIKDGTLQAQDMATLQTINPALKDELTKHLSKNMSDYMSGGDHIPYHVQQTLSLFLGTPLSSTLSPAGIQAAQGTYASKQPPGPPQQQGKGGNRPSKMSPKSANSYRTSSQSAESDRSGRND